MLELLILLAIILITGFILAMLTSIFIAYITQANYIDPLDGDEEDD
jgi:hypothetical protein